VDANYKDIGILTLIKLFSRVPTMFRWVWLALMVVILKRITYVMKHLR